MFCIDMFLQVYPFCEQNDSIQTVLQIRAQGSVPARPVQIEFVREKKRENETQTERSGSGEHV